MLKPILYGALTSRYKVLTVVEHLDPGLFCAKCLCGQGNWMPLNHAAVLASYDRNQCLLALHLPFCLLLILPQTHKMIDRSQKYHLAVMPCSSVVA